MNVGRLSAMTLPSRPRGTQEDHERVVVRFASLQLLALIYLQKFALFPSFQISVPMLVLLASVGWMVASQHLVFVVARLASYMVFVACCLWSESLAGGSIPSLLEVILLYGCMTVCSTLSEATYRQILNRFIIFMILPACIMIGQYSYQMLTGLSDPLNMERIVPSAMLLHNFYYAEHYPWNSFFVRPNGFFFLEPSFASAFTAAAAIIEITYFRRSHWAALMIVATALSIGGTGITMLVIAAPFLLARETPRVIAIVMVGVVVVGSVAYMADAHIPLLSRTDELGRYNASGSLRLTLPAARLAALVADPSYILDGDGSGASGDGKNDASGPIMSPWPIVKLASEYGLLSMVSFVVFYMSAIVGNFNLPLKIALSFEFQLTGGYLLSPVMVELVIMLCFMVAPERRVRPSAL